MTQKYPKIVFFGTPDFAVESLAALVDAGENIAAVVTMPDKIAGRGHKMIQSPVKDYALAHNLEVLQPERLKSDEFVNRLREINADLFIVIAFRMLPEIVWSMPALGTFNLHGSLLPRYRGAAPLNWAVINGETETGVTTFFLKHEIDTGDIIDSERIEIGPDENVGSVHDRLMKIGARLTLSTVERIRRGNLTAVSQDKLLNGEEPTPAPKIFKETCEIHWDRPMKEVHNLVRGLSPYPGAWTDINSNILKIFATSLSGARTSDKAPGTPIADHGRLWITCADGKAIEVLEIQPTGKRKMPVADFLNGLRPGNGIVEV